MSKDTKKDRELPKSNASGNNKAFKFRTLDENAEEKNSIDVKSNDKDTKECSFKDFNKDLGYFHTKYLRITLRDTYRTNP